MDSKADDLTTVSLSPQRWLSLADLTSTLFTLGMLRCNVRLRRTAARIDTLAL